MCICSVEFELLSIIVCTKLCVQLRARFCTLAHLLSKIMQLKFKNKLYLVTLNSANLATVFSYLFVLLARSSPHEPRIHDQGLLVPGLSENTNTAY